MSTIGMRTFREQRRDEVAVNVRWDGVVEAPVADMALKGDGRFASFTPLTIDMQTMNATGRVFIGFRADPMARSR